MKGGNFGDFLAEPRALQLCMLCGMFPDQRASLHPLHRKVDSYFLCVCGEGCINYKGYIRLQRLYKSLS